MGVGLAVAAIGAGLKAYNAHDTSRRRDNETAQGLVKQGETQREADAQVNRALNTLKRSGPDAVRNESMQGFLGALRANRGNAVSGTGGIGGKRYAADTAAAQKGVGDYGSRVASLLARINAPTQQRRVENQSFAQLGTDISGLKRASEGDAYLTDLRTRAIQPNPWVDLAGDVAMGAGTGMAAKGGPAKAGMSVKGGNYNVPVGS